MDCFTVLMEHRVTVYSVSSGTDTGAGTVLTYAVRQAGVECLLNVQGAGAQSGSRQAGAGESFGQDQLTQSVVCATFYTGAQRGDKLVVTAGPSLVGASLHITGIKDQPGLASLGFDEIVHLTCTRLL